MSESHRYTVGDIVRFKKSHPCGNDQWEVLRTGIDFRVKCLGCNHIIWLPRKKLEKSIKEIVQRKTLD